MNAHSESSAPLTAADICNARVDADPDACGGGSLGYHAIGEPGGCPECIAEAAALACRPAHSELGASGAHRWMNCPASVRLSRGVPDRTSAAAERGTAAHEVAHLCLLAGQNACEYVDRTVSGIVVDAGMADDVQLYLDECRSVPAADRWYEVQFDLAVLDPPSPMFGTADFVAYDPVTAKLYVRDYKNGYMAVDAEDNPQLRYYALGAMLWLGDNVVSDIDVAIVQPNNGGVKRDTFDALDLMEWACDMLAAARRTQQPDAPAVPGTWCKFCPASPCAAQAAARLEDARTDFAGALALPEVRLLTPAELGALHARAAGIRAFLDAVETAVTANPAGTGWKLVPTQPQAGWADDDAAATALAHHHGVDPHVQRLITPAQARTALRDMLHATGIHATKKQAEEAAREELEPLISRTSSGTKLVPDADPRPAITSGAEFDNL